MEAFLLLCDAANTDTGSRKLNMLGAGWSITGPMVPASALAGFLRAPWGEAGDSIGFSLCLVDEKGDAVRLSVDGDEVIRFSGSFSVPSIEIQDEMAKRVPLNIAFAIPLPPLPLQAGHMYRWILNAQGERVAQVDFVVRPAQ